MRNLFILILICLFSSCDKHEIEMEYPYKGDGTQIEIYLIKNELIKDFNPFEEVGINDMEENPWLSHDKIIFYDWSSHSFYLKEEQTNNKGGRYFVLTADKKPVFAGFFYTSFMSTIPQTPLIISDFGFTASSDVISLTYRYENSDSLFSETSKFRTVMENSGLLKEGINVELLNVSRKNSTTLDYTYKVENLDNEIIYILDPDKMGSSRFHYFTNGVGLRKDEINYWVKDFETTASDYIKSNWYYKLSPGKTVTRTITLNGYHSLPTGVVTASFHFPGSYQLDVGEWEKPDGRIWIGDFVCRKEMILR